ncbi:cell division ATP-binding protein FtsE [Candidatus Gottesmanbacteria bacterium]|nr:cell division ATP-binding protein FtsE [Candidatus Gottesmanbacteria bacterium]
MIELQKVTKRFGLNTFALSDISLVIESGEFVFIVGPTGSGKTTLLRLLTNEVIPTSGKVIVDKEDLARIPNSHLTKLRRKVGVVFQDFKLLFDRTVFENIALPLEINRISSKEITPRVEKILEIVGLVNQRNLFPTQLSGGETQRAAIARAIINEPKIILADEPTGNLDPATGWEIIKLLKDINKRKLATIIMATHNIDIVNSLGKRVVRLESGKIIKDQKEGRYEKS